MNQVIIMSTSENKTITAQELAELLKTITRSTFVSITYIVDDSRSKTVKGVKQVQKKVNVCSVALNHSYENKVRNLTGDDTFVAQPLKGKTRVCSTLLQSDKTEELMIDGKVLYSQAVTLLEFFHNGESITEEEAVNQDLWTPSYYNPSETATAGRGTVREENDFWVINTYLSRIVEIKISGVIYTIEG